MSREMRIPEAAELLKTLNISYSEEVFWSLVAKVLEVIALFCFPRLECREINIECMKGLDKLGGEVMDDLDGLEIVVVQH